MMLRNTWTLEFCSVNCQLNCDWQGTLTYPDPVNSGCGLIKALGLAALGPPPLQWDVFAHSFRLQGRWCVSLSQVQTEGERAGLASHCYLAGHLIQPLVVPVSGPTAQVPVAYLLRSIDVLTVEMYSHLQTFNLKLFKRAEVLIIVYIFLKAK
jgi:hypothetical protein